MQSLAQALHWLEQTANPAAKADLSRFASVLSQQPLPRFACPVISVSGTNGKGSCIHLLQAIYQAAGWRVASTTSPHLWQFNERIQLQGQPVADDVLTAALQHLSQLQDIHCLSYHDITTLAALRIFADFQADVVLLEVGVGGRYDAVNLIDADVVIITNVALDHCALLGATREEIAWNKAGLLRSKCPLIYGEWAMPENLMPLAENLQVPIYQAGKAYTYSQSETGETWCWHSERPSETQSMDSLPMPEVMLENAAASLMAVNLLQDRLPVASAAIHQGLQQVRVPARSEYYQGQYPYLFDVAHNPAACQQLAKTLRQRLASTNMQRCVALCAMLQDKDLSGCVQPLAPYIDRWYLADLAHPRAANASTLKQVIAKFSSQPSDIYADVPHAMHAIHQAIDADTLVLVFGSFITVAHAYCNKV
jgi:dihydrofolate synthase/folylpolyglutamate synthase